MKPTRAAKTPPPQIEQQVTSGFPSPAEDYEEPPLDLHHLVVSNPQSTYFMRAASDNMRGAGIWPGDILTVDRSLKPRVGAIVVAVIDDSFVLKKCTGIAEALTLSDDLGSVEAGIQAVWGIVTYITRKL